MSNLKCCGCGTTVNTDYISHAMTDLPGTDGENWGDTAIMLCEGCYAATLRLTRAEDFRQYQKWMRHQNEVAGESNESATPTRMIGRHPAPFTYSPSGDSDGETVGTDQFVLDAAGTELACPPDEAVARLFAASPELLAACESLLAFDWRSGDGAFDLYERAGAAIAKAKGVSIS